MFDLNIHKTYIYFLRKHLHTFAFCILMSKQFTGNELCQSLFLLKLHENETSGRLFSCDFAKLLRTLFHITPQGDCLIRSWHDVVRDVSALFLMMDFKEC